MRPKAAACRMGLLFLDCGVRVMSLHGRESRWSLLAGVVGAVILLCGSPANGGEPQDRSQASLFAMDGWNGLSLRLSSSSHPRRPSNSEPLSWTEALTLAMQQSSLVQAVTAQAQAQASVAQQAWAQAYMPRLDLNAQWQQAEESSQRDMAVKPSSSTGLQASLPLWHGADRVTEQAQAELSQRADWLTRSARMTVARDVSRAYLLAVDAFAQLGLMREQQAILSEQLRVNEQRLRGGVGTSLDRLETATRLDQLQADLHERQGLYDSQRLELSRLLGQNVPQVATLNPHALPNDDGGPNVVESLEEALSHVPDRSLAVQEAQALVRTARLNIQARRAETWHPTIDVIAGLNRVRQITKTAESQDTLNYTERTLGVQLTMPIYSGGRQPARTQESTALLIKAEAERDEAMTRAQAELNDAYQRLMQYRRQVRALRHVADTAQATLDALHRAFVAGYRSNLDLLNAQQQLIATRSQSVTARINVLLAQVDILCQTERLDAVTVSPLLTNLTTTLPPLAMKDLP